MGGRAEIAIPEGTHTLDLDGRTVLPGFVMLHEHWVHGSENANTHPEPFTSPRLFLAFGVTTIQTAGTIDPYLELNLKRKVDRGEVPCPELHLTGPFFSGEGGFPHDKVVRDAEDGRRVVRYSGRRRLHLIEGGDTVSKSTGRYHR